MSNACSALVHGICTNGFMVTPWCDPVQPVSACHACRRPYEKQPIPMCLNEKMCGDYLEDEGGRPSDARVESARRQAAARASLADALRSLRDKE